MAMQMTVTQMKEIVIRMGMTLECSPWHPMWLTLILVMTKILMEFVIAVMMMLKTTQTRAIMMKRDLNPLDLKTFFYMIVMMN